MQPSSATIYRIGSELEFGPTGTGTALLHAGWSTPEPDGFTWSDGPDATLRFTLAMPTRDMTCHVALMPFTAPGLLQEQRVSIFFNHFRVGYAELRAGRQTVSFALPRELFIMRSASLLLHIPGAASPHELGIGDDRRRLGVALWSLQIAPAA